MSCPLGPNLRGSKTFETGVDFLRALEEFVAVERQANHNKPHAYAQNCSDSFSSTKKTLIDNVSARNIEWISHNRCRLCFADESHPESMKGNWNRRNIREKGLCVTLEVAAVSGRPARSYRAFVNDASGGQLELICEMERSEVEHSIRDKKEKFEVAVGHNDLLQMRFRICESDNSISFKRMHDALLKIHKSLESCSKIIDFIINGGNLDGNHRDSTTEKTSNSNLVVDTSLNELQNEAVIKAWNSKYFHMIHGPPGTGKTTVLCEIIKQYIKSDKRVLYLATSNLAVDNLIFKLENKLNEGIESCPSRRRKHELSLIEQSKLLRYGKDANIAENNLKYHIDTFIEKSSFGKDLFKLKQELSKLQTNTRGQLRNRSSEVAQRIKDLKFDIKLRKRNFKQMAVNSSKLVCSTLTSIDFDKFDDMKNKIESFDVIIIDEVSQALIPAALIPITYSAKLIVAGDHIQLPPTVISQQYTDDPASDSFMNLLKYRCENASVVGDNMTSGTNFTTMLTVQYRMHNLIMKWPSNTFYSDKLIAHPSCSERTLIEGLHIISNSNDPNLSPIIFIDSTSDSENEQTPIHSSSHTNEYEAILVCIHVLKLLKCGISGKRISIISPYSGQVSLIYDLLAKFDISRDIEVNSIDGFQGRECDVIVISMVRSNFKKEIGFLKDLRRLNVALTRAKLQLCFICDSNTLSNSKVEAFSSLIDYLKLNGEIYDGNLYYEEIEKFRNILNQTNDIENDLKEIDNKIKESKIRNQTLPLKSKNNSNDETRRKSNISKLPKRKNSVMNKNFKKSRDSKKKR